MSTFLLSAKGWSADASTDDGVLDDTSVAEPEKPKKPFAPVSTETYENKKGVFGQGNKDKAADEKSGRSTPWPLIMALAF